MNPETIGTCFNAAINQLPKREAEIITAHALNINRATLYSHTERLTSVVDTRRHQYWVHRRRMGEPISYITGSKEFWSMDFKINRTVLIPRHDTEKLVEIAIDLTNPSDQILDIGCGSGAVAVAIAKETNGTVFASDVEVDCVALTKKNALRNSVSVETLVSDWFSKISSKFNLIVSNPPYLSSSEVDLFSTDLRWEPTRALISGDDGLKALRVVITSSIDFLRVGGYLLVEHGYNQQIPVTDIFKNTGFENIETYNDLNGLPRVTKGVRP